MRELLKTDKIYDGYEDYGSIFSVLSNLNLRTILQDMIRDAKNIKLQNECEKFLEILYEI